MIPRFLFGPTTNDFADIYLGEVRSAGRCLAFGPGGVDLAVGPEACWDYVAAQFPPGWRPDLVALWLNYSGVPDCLWSAPVPIIGLATDWNLLWHEYRPVLPFCDAVLTDEPGVDVVAGAGIGLARPAVLYGAAHRFARWFQHSRTGHRRAVCGQSSSGRAAGAAALAGAIGQAR